MTMAVLTHLLGANAMRAMCGIESSPMAGMDAMYMLMSIFHSAPWLKLIMSRANMNQGGPTE
jgi:hypothetical protein